MIYVQNGAFGNENGFVACSNPSSSAGQLLSDSKINLNDKVFYFTDNITPYNIEENKVAIGYSCSEAVYE